MTTSMDYTSLGYVQYDYMKDRCKCNGMFDVRCRCYIGDKTFKNCPMRFATISFYITNGYDFYNKMDQDWNNIEKIKKENL